MRALAPNTSRTAAERALAPSMTTSSPSSNARPRETRSASRVRTTVLFSVEPSHSPTGFLVPSAVMASATTTQRSPRCSPSSMSTLMSSPVKSRAINSASAVSVWRTNRREIAERLVDFACLSTRVPTGSAGGGGPGGAHRGPRRIVLALGPARLGHFGLKHRGHHCHPGGHAHRQQPLPGHAGDVGHRQCDLLRQIGQHHGIGRVSKANSRYGLHGGPLLLLRGVLGGSPEDLPPGRPQVRDRHLKFHEDRDNLACPEPTALAAVT